MPSIHATEVNGTLSYPTDPLTQGGSGYSKHTTSVPMTVIYTMNTKKLPTGFRLPVTRYRVTGNTHTRETCNTHGVTGHPWFATGYP